MCWSPSIALKWVHGRAPHLDSWSAAFSKQLMQKVRPEKFGDDPHYQLTNMLRRALDLVGLADSNEASKDQNIIEAMNALRGIIRTLAGLKLTLHDIAAALPAGFGKFDP
jgi:hypothetical protein